MKKLIKMVRHSMLSLALGMSVFEGSVLAVTPENQTPTVSPVYPSDDLPFDVEIELADFSLPNGLQSYAWASYQGRWLLIAGRTNGMHTFNNDNNNFPPLNQNQVVYVVDPKKGTVASKALTDPTAGLTQKQIDDLSSTATQYYRKGKTLYITGGYGFDTALGQFTTKDTLTAIDIPGLMHWVSEPFPKETAQQHIRQISDPLFRVTGGDMYLNKDGTTLLIFGQDFEGAYFHFSFDGIYSEQVRRFKIIDNGKALSFKALPSLPSIPDPNYRRRDLNTVPVVRMINGKIVPAFVAFSGVFTLSGGAWTVPVEISSDGVPFMADPNNPNTFKQAMNNYASAHLRLFSKKQGCSYTVFFGGITYQYFSNGFPVASIDLPFDNEVTTIQIDRCGKFTQFLLNGTYPFMVSTQSNPGNQLLFGASADFIPLDDISQYGNDVLRLDGLLKKNKRVLVGHIVGGIQSTVQNTESASDSAASPFIFNVFLVPKNLSAL